ncbi:MAG: hypothetical protein J6U69_00660 [Alistipes sp.]|nr:hypothetical protein [Alistipes sp.]
MRVRFLALLAMVLGMVSCQQDFNGLTPVPVGGEVDFQLAVAAPELGATRADDGDTQYGNDSAFGAIDYLNDEANQYRTDWSDVNLRYTLEVYDADALTEAPVKDRQVIIVDKYEPVKFDLRLIPNREYRFVVFADFVPQAFTDVTVTDDVQSEAGLHHSLGSTLQSITIKSDAINDECTDAYFAFENITIENSAPKSITLKRPYGKVRVIATDLAELNLNVDPASVVVKYTAKHPQAFNAVTGSIDAEKDSVYTLSSAYNEGVGKESLANHFYTEGYDKETTTNAKNDKRHTHMTLFTDYILAVDNEQRPINFEMSVYEESGELIKTTEFSTMIPVQRNHLTTIIGNVLTTATEINVTIDDNFENADRQYYVFEALVNGGEVTLDRDYVIGRPLFVEADAILNLNGFSITTSAKNQETDAIIVRPGGKLTINGEGTIEAVTDTDGYAVISEGELVINGGTFKAGVDKNGEANAVIYARGNGKVYVNGGEFPNGAESVYVLNKKDSDRKTTTIEVRGGRYYKFNPANNAAENPKENFVAPGFASIKDGDWYIIEAANDYVDKGDHMEIYTVRGLGMWAYLVNYVEGYKEYGVKFMTDITLPQYEVYVDHDNQAYAYDYTKPIDGTNSNWIPVRNVVKVEPDGYSGDVMGEGHTISGLRVNRTDNYAGFIGFMYNGGSITNLTFVDAEVKGAVCVGVALGRAQDAILLENIEVKGSSVSGTGHVGGITGYNYSRVGGAQGQGYAEGPAIVRNCTVDANTTVASSGDNIGGIVGTNYGGTVIDCENRADVTGNSSVGGIVGYSRDYHHNKDGYIVACTTYPEATIKATKATNGKAGGIAGGVMTDNGHSNTYMHVVACTSFSKIEGATKGCIAGSISGKQHTASCVAVKNGANVLYGNGKPTTESDVEDAILYDAATDASQADVDALNAAIAHFNELNPPAEAVCNYTWTLENNFPVLKKN